MSHEELPTLREELDRKVIDTLTSAAELHDMGRITADQLSTIARAAWDVSAGLVSPGVMELLQQVGNSVSTPASRRTFFGPAGLVQLLWSVAKPGLLMVSTHPTTLQKKPQRLGEPDIEGHERDQKIKQVAQALTGKGFIEVK